MGVRGRSGGRLSRTIGVISIGYLAAAFAGLALAQSPAGPACSKSDFEAVVDEAAASLRDLNQKNKPDFQERLKSLKDKRGWTHDQFMSEGAPLVKDETIAGFEAKSSELLEQISTLGQDGAAAKTPDCGLLIELKARMKLLVEIQGQKWSYMFRKLDAALAK